MLLLIKDDGDDEQMVVDMDADPDDPDYVPANEELEQQQEGTFVRGSIDLVVFYQKITQDRIQVFQHSTFR